MIKPRALVHEKMMAASYQAHPYRHPVIGWMNDLENMTFRDAKAWYERWYAPNNAVLVVVGDVNPKEVLALAQKFYGPIKPGEPLPLDKRKPQIEPQQVGIKRITVKAPAQLPYLAMVYHAPALRNPSTDWEPYALEMLAGVLDGNESARLNKTLVREQRIASSAGARLRFDGAWSRHVLSRRHAQRRQNSSRSGSGFARGGGKDSCARG